MNRESLMNPARLLPRLILFAATFLCLSVASAFEPRPHPIDPIDPVRTAVLTIDYPAPGATVLAPGSLKIQATAVDPDGDIRRVEFFANERLIGVSQHFTKDAVIPGRPRVHYLEWQDVPAGEHVLSARAIATSGAKVESKPVPITVLKSGGSEQVVRLFAAREATAEISPTALVLPGQFIVTRKGDLNLPLRVFLEYSGSATAGKDYAELPTTVGFEPGQDKADLLVIGAMDSEIEPEETVVATLVASPLAGPLPSYVIDSQFASAVVTIADSSSYHTTPIVSIEATRIETTEPSPTTRIAPAVFTLHRTGSLDGALEVFLKYEGTARPEADYNALPESVMFERGAAKAEILVGPVDDDLVEGDETVVAHIVEPPYQTLGLVPAYLIDPKAGVARVVIRDNDWSPGATVEILSPRTGAQFPPGAAVKTEAVAIDPHGFINRLELLREGRVIGVSEIVFIQAPPDGSPIHHSFEWIGPEAGSVELTARGIDANGHIVMSKPVVIEFGGEGNGPIVGIQYLAPPVFSPWPETESVPGQIQIYRRDLNLDLPLPVFIAVGGTATAGEDYAKLPEAIEIPKGESSVIFSIEAKDDALPEGDESIVIEILPPPDTTRPIAQPYRISAEHGRVAVRLFDNDVVESKASLKFTEPENGTKFESGAEITFRLIAQDPDGYISHVEFYSGEKMLGVSNIQFFRAPDPGTPIHHEFIWLNVPAGEHKIFAKAVDSLGQSVSSAPLYFVVARDVESRQVVLAVDATDWLGAEIGPDGAPDPVVFTIRRVGGPSDVGVLVRYTLDGNAVNGEDYSELSGSVELPAGRESVEVVVKPIQDKLEEGDEAVALILQPAVCIAIHPPPPDCYLLSDRDGAKARLLEVLAVPDEDTKPRFLAAGKTPAGKATLQIGAPSGQRCVLETSEDLIHWTEIGTVEVIDGEANFPEDAGPAKRQAFYRLRLLQAED